MFYRERTLDQTKTLEKKETYVFDTFYSPLLQQKASPCEILPTFIQSWKTDLILKKQDI